MSDEYNINIELDAILESASSSIPSSDTANIEIQSNNITIDNIEEEDKLIHYTDNHFLNKVYSDLLKFNESKILQKNDVEYLYSNSPITISNNGSRSNSDSDNNNYSSDENESNDNENMINMVNSFYKKNFTKLSFNDVEKSIDKYYDLTNSNKYSTELDILNTFVKGQKNLYIQSKYITQHKLNLLMFPSLFISTFITILAPFIECHQWSSGVISALNALIMFLISMINYLKLESAIEVYVYNAKNYDKLETLLEMTNNKLIFLESEKEKRMLVLNKIKEVEKKMYEIKDSTNVLVPEEIKRLFPVICNINIFSFIKNIKVLKKNLVLKLQNVKNEIRYILYRWNNNPNCQDTPDYIKEKNRLLFLQEIKEKIKEDIFEFTTAYSHIDTLFIKEIKLAESKKNNWGLCFLCFFKPKVCISDYRISNPIIDKYFQIIFADE